MRKKEFKAVVEGLWECFRRSVCIINTLEAIGLTVEPGTEKENLGMLYGIQDTMAKSIMKVLDIEDEGLLGEIDSFLVESADSFAGTEGLPEEIFTELLRIIEAYGHYITWDESREIIFNYNTPVVKHRALPLNGDKEPVVGYIWNGCEHAYIIPENCGIGYDDATSTLKAHAVEIDKSTIAAETHIRDDKEKKRLFYGDTVRIKEKEFVLKPMDLETVRYLSEYRGERSLQLVKSNYE